MSARQSRPKALIIGCVPLVLALAALLFQTRRLALISLIAIPVALIAGALVLYLRRGDPQYDGAGGVRDRRRGGDRRRDPRRRKRHRRLRQARNRGSIKSIAAIILEAAVEMRSNMIYATLILVLGDSAGLLHRGLAGAFFQPLALSYLLAVLAAMLVALTVTPALNLLLLS